MRYLFVFFSALLFTFGAEAQDVQFSGYFKDATMRVDYFHNGNFAAEHFSIDRILNDGPWAGSQKILTDNLEFGLYFYEIQDLETEKTLFSRGFASIFGEWQSIPEAKETWGTFHESIRFPWPLKPVKIIMKKRNAKNEFEQIWETKIDPESRKVNPATMAPEFKTWDYLVNGPAHQKVDIVILCDGYTAKEMDKFHADIQRLMGAFFEVEPFKSRKADFNVRAVETPSAQSGVNKPHPGNFKRTPLSMSYSAFDSERYALTYDNRSVRDAAAEVPYEFMYILVNERTYGGGGIYRLYATVASDNAFSDYIFVHEFGHHFAALADEYYSSAVSYEISDEILAEPWEANVTALLDPANLKWKELVEPGIPLPTPWPKKKVDEFSYEIQKERKKLRAEKAPEEVLEALFNKQKKHETQMLENFEYADKVGAYEGANYMQHGLFRSYPDCIMFTRNKNDFCPACQRAIGWVIDQYVD
jgi:IgA Peptidase M64/Peptidase M64 N-terminus